MATDLNGTNSALESESLSSSVNKQMLPDVSSSESMSKVCQEELFHPLLSALSADNIAEVPLNSKEQSLAVTYSLPSQSTSPENQNLISTGSNTSPSFTRSECAVNSTVSQDTSSPVTILNSGTQSENPEPTIAHQTVTTTIPSHPSTIQYIPIIQTPITQQDSSPLNVRTVHLISAVASQSDTATSSENTGRTSTIHYQYVPTMHQNRNTIHYPPGNIQIIHSGSSLIMSSNSLITAALQSVTATGTEGNSSSTTGNNFLQIIPSSSPQSSALVRNIQLMSVASEEQSESNNSESSLPSDSISDHNIRVLTPSEIMKTLPSLGQESFDVTSSTVSSSVAHFAFFLLYSSWICLFRFLHFIILLRL